VRERGDEFGLGTRLEPVVVRRAVLDDVEHGLLLLVDLDGIHAAVRALVVVILDGLCERLVDEFDARGEQVAEAQEDGRLHAAFVEAVNDVVEPRADAAVFVAQPHRREPVGRDVEMAVAPGVNAV
jgi:hypothetical protein